MPHLRALFVSLLIAVPCAAQNVCPPASHYDGFHQENVGVSLASEGYGAFFGHVSGFSAAFFEKTPWEHWMRTALLPSPLEPASYGGPVALSENLALIGDTNDKTFFSGGLFGHGAAVLYDRVDGGFEIAAELLPPVPEVFQSFGSAVAISPDETWLAVGAQRQGGSRGAVYFYDGATNWGLDLEWTPDTVGTNDFFGWAVALADEWAFVGAPSFWGGAEGRVFVFHLQDGSWSEVDVLETDDDAGVPNFGSVLDYEDGRLFVGSPSESHEDGGNGSVYVFEFDGAAWSESLRLTADTEDVTQSFGRALDAAGSNLVVGAYRRVLAYEADGAGWDVLEVIDDPTNISFSDFGEAVAWYPDGVLVGAGNYDGNGFDYPDNTGAVLSFDLRSVGESLRACTGTASVAFPTLGNSVELRLDAPSQAGRDYFLLGSISGTGPFPIGSIVLPLTPDPYFTLTVKGSPTLVDGAGTLDAEGTAQAEFVVPEGSSPALIGLRVRHAYLTLNEVGNVAFASNAVAIRLVD